ncbi:hypothetical protein EIN_083820 [Entamoeba invadens IP1]|uniref:hypothetical protein n=1 Tax=Entamoeba invadens IP1 TaxID=370355 RepID=UPI0002C3CE8E|nr:hypothetical protein EIN_083820 [Entamoeba invadens IP1]ELP85240.1 hypothetical protein EIN_083820 [Entamoeba invadens IP1]|eukprot:XP_004184586.1 hypothetical protein EIN_083820 [Entamoeba invadens IP1]
MYAIQQQQQTTQKYIKDYRFFSFDFVTQTVCQSQSVVPSSPEIQSKKYTPLTVVNTQQSAQITSSMYKPQVFNTNFQQQPSHPQETKFQQQSFQGTQQSMNGVLQQNIKVLTPPFSLPKTEPPKTQEVNPINAKGVGFQPPLILQQNNVQPAHQSTVAQQPILNENKLEVVNQNLATPTKEEIKEAVPLNFNGNEEVKKMIEIPNMSVPQKSELPVQHQIEEIPKEHSDAPQQLQQHTQITQIPQPMQIPQELPTVQVTQDNQPPQPMDAQPPLDFIELQVEEPLDSPQTSVPIQPPPVSQQQIDPPKLPDPEHMTPLQRKNYENEKRKMDAKVNPYSNQGPPTVPLKGYMIKEVYGVRVPIIYRQGCYELLNKHFCQMGYSPEEARAHAIEEEKALSEHSSDSQNFLIHRSRRFKILGIELPKQKKDKPKKKEKKVAKQ